MPVPPAAVGAASADTPSLHLDLTAFEANLRTLSEMMEKTPKIALRPNVKSHKCVEIASLQMLQPGTLGVACPKVSEAVAMADAVGDVLVTHEVVSEHKARRLAVLPRRGCKVTAVVDSELVARVLAAAARAEGTRLSVLIDVNVGHNRCGVDSPEEALGLAQLLSELDTLDFRGIQAHHVLSQRIRSFDGRRTAAEEAASRAKRFVEALDSEGFRCDIVTGGGTGTFEFDAASGVYTEVQPASYVFSDVGLSENLDADGQRNSCWQHSLFVGATVVSRNEVSHRVVVDAGLKAISYDSGTPTVRGLPDGAALVECGGDEHTIVHFARGTPLPALGDQIEFTPGHCEATVNLHEYILGMRSGRVESVWPVAARGPGF